MDKNLNAPNLPTILADLFNEAFQDYLGIKDANFTWFLTPEQCGSDISAQDTLTNLFDELITQNLESNDAVSSYFLHYNPDDENFTIIGNIENDPFEINYRFPVIIGDNIHFIIHIIIF